MANDIPKRGLEIPPDDLADLTGFVAAGFSGIDLARLSYRLGCFSVRQEDLDRLNKIIEQTTNSMIIEHTAHSTPAGSELCANGIATQASASGSANLKDDSA